MYGADTQQLRELASTLIGAADELRTTTRRLTATIDQTHWQGQDAEGLKGRWRTTNRARLSAAADQLETTANDLRRNADEQDRASGALGSGPATPWAIAGTWAVAGTGRSVSMGPLASFNLRTFTGDALDSLSWIQKARNVGDVLKNGSDYLKWFQAGGEMPPIGEIGQYASARGIPILDIASGGADIIYNVQEYGPGDARSWEAMVNAGVDTGLNFVPGGAVLKLGYTAGFEGTSFLLDKTGAGDAISDTVFESTYDTDGMTPTEAREMVERTRNPISLGLDIVKGIF